MKLLQACSAVTVLLIGLTGCSLLPQTAPVDVKPIPHSETSEPVKTPEAGTTETSTGLKIVTLSEEEQSPVPVYTESKPAGTWDLIQGVPVGWPAGVPIYADRSIKGQFLAYEASNGTTAYSSMVNMTYAELDILLEEYKKQGYVVTDDKKDDTKRVVILLNDVYKIVINGSESAVNPQTSALYDASMTIIATPLY